MQETVPMQTDQNPVLRMNNGKAIKMKKVKWLWQPRIAQGSITLIAGRGGSGKSTLAAELCASITSAIELPHHPARKGRKGSVLWMASEESVASVVIPRLRAAQANMLRVYFPGVDDAGRTFYHFNLNTDAQLIIRLVEESKAEMIVVDPLAGFCPGTDLNQQQAAREVLGRMRTVSEKTGVAWLVITHPNKSRTGNVVDRIFGSGAITQFARSVLLVGEHPEGDGRRVVCHAKCNEGPLAPTLAFRLSPDVMGQLPPSIVWLGEVPITSDMMGVESMDAGDMDQHADARAMLKKLLKEWRPAVEVLKEGTSCGIGERSLRAAKAELKCGSRRVTDDTGLSRWEWGPPGTKADGAQADEKQGEDTP